MMLRCRATDKNTSMEKRNSSIAQENAVRNIIPLPLEYTKTIIYSVQMNQ